MSDCVPPTLRLPDQTSDLITRAIGNPGVIRLSTAEACPVMPIVMTASILFEKLQTGVHPDTSNLDHSSGNRRSVELRTRGAAGRQGVVASVQRAEFLGTRRRQTARSLEDVTHRILIGRTGGKLR